ADGGSGAPSLTIRKNGNRGAVVARTRSTSSSDRRSSNPPGPAPRRSSGALAQWSRTNAAGSPAQRSIAEGMLAVGGVGAIAAEAAALAAVGAVGVAVAVAVDPVGPVPVGAVRVLGVGHGGRRGRAGPLGVLAPGGDDVLVLDTRGAVAHGALLGGSAAEAATLAPLGRVETPEGSGEGGDHLAVVLARLLFGVAGGGDAHF